MSKNNVKDVQTTELVQYNEITKEIVSLEEKDGLWNIVVKQVDVPPELVYTIGRGHGAFLASFYDLVAKELGMQFSDPEIIFEDDFKVRVNCKVRYWNRAGKMVLDSETYEVDCRILYQKARFGWIEGFWKNNEYHIKKDAKGNERKATITLTRNEKHPDEPPQVAVWLPDDAEIELRENFLTLQRNKTAKAITCAHRRLIQRSLGIKGFSYDPDDDKWKDKVKLTFIAFLPAEADKKAGVQAVNDLGGGETPAEITEVHPVKDKKEETAAAPAKEKEAAKTGTDKPATPGSVDPLKCSGEGCGAKVTKKVSEYSRGKYKRVLCMDCQQKELKKEK